MIGDRRLKPKCFPKPLVHTSASQVKKFLRCPRAWAFDKLDGVPRTEHPATALGKRVHTILEDWLREGVVPDLNEVYTYERNGKMIVRYPGRIAHAGLHLLPAPRAPGISVEGEFLFKTPATKWLGYIDLRYAAPDGTPIIHDHKTTSSPRYALTTETLRHDPQAMLYAGVEMARTGARAVQLDWTYFPTTLSPRPWKVSLRVLRDEIAPDLDRLDGAADLMMRACRAGMTAAYMPYNPAACGDYGGCDYAAFCERNPSDLFREETDNVESPNANDALAALDQILGGTPAAPPPPPPASAAPAFPPEGWAPHPDAPGYFHNGTEVLTEADLRARLAPPPAPPAPPAPPVATPAASGDLINPPEAPPPAPEQPPVAPAPEVEAPVIPAGGLDAMDRASLKALAQHHGIVDASCRYGAPRLIQELRLTFARASAAPAAPTAPAQPPAAPAAPPPAPVAPIDAPEDIAPPLFASTSPEARAFWGAAFLHYRATSAEELAAEAADRAFRLFQERFGR